MSQDKQPNVIKDNVAETLYIPLFMKCKESEREDGFFKDPLSCELVKRIDYDFSKYQGAVRSSVGVAIRAGFFDDVATDFIRTHTSPIVVNVGCGLDTRFHRIDKAFTDKAIFYELDLPEVMELRAKLLPAAHNDIYLHGSMFETGWMNDLKDKHPQGDFLLILEGVLMYFEKPLIKGLFSNLAARFNQSDFLFDVTSSWLCKNSHKHDTVKFTNAPFKLALDDDKEIETWADNLRLVNVKRFDEFSDWKYAGFINYWVVKLIPAMKNASRIVQYKTL